MTDFNELDLRPTDTELERINRIILSCLYDIKINEDISEEDAIYKKINALSKVLEIYNKGKRHSEKVNSIADMISDGTNHAQEFRQIAIDMPVGMGQKFRKAYLQIMSSTFDLVDYTLGVFDKERK